MSDVGKGTRNEDMYIDIRIGYFMSLSVVDVESKVHKEILNNNNIPPI